MIIDDRLFSSHQEDSCFSLQRTNPRLSGNFKIVIANESAAYLESISASQYLANQDFKALPISFDRPHARNIQALAKKAASTKYWYDIEFSSTLGTSSYDSQYSQKYDWGAYTEVNAMLPGRYRFFAPLWVNTDLPDRFLIFRTSNTEFSDLASYFKNGTLVKSFDLTGDSKIGSYLRTFIDHINFKRWCLRFSFNDKAQFHGIDITKGELTSYFEDRINSYLANERTLTEFNNIITNGWMRGNLILHKLFNLEFVFDDPGSANGFNNYVGVYVKNNEVTAQDAKTLSQQGNALKRTPIILNVNNEKTQLYDINNILPPYYTTVASNMIVDSNQELPPVFLFKVTANPDRNSKIVLSYENNVEVEIKIQNEDLFADLAQTTLAISNRINNYSFSAQNISFRSYVYIDQKFNQRWVVIHMQQTASILENVIVTLPKGLTPLKPDEKIPSSNLHFIGVTKQDVLIKEYVNINTIDRIVIGGNAYQVQYYYEYLGYKLLRLANFNSDTRFNNVTIKLQKLNQSKILKSAIVKHRDFDFSTHEYYYDKLFDWDLTAYKNYMLSIVDDDSYVGAWNPDLTSMTLPEYRQLVRDAIVKYFTPIKENSQLLIKDLDLITLEASATVSSEFDRFAENTQTDFLNKNFLEAFVSKWGHNDGVNAYAQPYGLNTNMVFRSDNFAPNHRSNQRDINANSHSWFVIGEGPNPYLNTMHVQMSYSQEPITIDGLKSIINDEYNKLFIPVKYPDNTYYNKFAWSNFYAKEGTPDTYKTFFRGLDLEIAGDFSGYRFAAILLSKEAFDLESESDILELVVNRKFKTVTLVIKFQIPDPILTSQERGNDFYYLDRSLLYYINEVLQSNLVVEVFGTAKISLNLYDTELVKFIESNPVDDNLWYLPEYPAGSGEPAFWIGRGDSSTFNTSFKDLISTGQTFNWRHIRRLDTGEDVIVKFSAKECFSIEDNYFWCRDIEMELYNGHDRSLKDEYFAWNGEGTLIDKVNEWYIAKAISYYNSIYDNVVSASQNSKRYRKIAFGSLMTLLKNFKIKTNFINSDGNEEISELTLNPIEPRYTYLINTKTENNGTIELLDKAIAYPVYRYDAYYGPIFRDVHIPVSSNLGDSVYFGQTFPGIRYFKKVVKNNTPTVLIDQYQDNRLSNIFSLELYKYYDSLGNGSAITTLINREEWSNLISSIFKYQDTFQVIASSTNRMIDLIIPLKTLLYSIVFGTETITTTQKILALTLYYDITTVNHNQFDEKLIMFKNFYDSLFSKIYRVTKVVINDSSIPFKYKDRSSIEVSQDYANVDIIVLTFERN